jgi:predicted ester cyclase
MSAENEAVVRRFFEELCNQRMGEVADEIIAPEFEAHIPQSPPARGPQGARESLGLYQQALEGQWEVQEMYSAGDERVVTRWIGRGRHVGELMGIAPTNATIAVDALSIHRVIGGKIVEDHTVWDALGLLQQIGAVPAPATA